MAHTHDITAGPALADELRIARAVLDVPAALPLDLPPEDLLREAAATLERLLGCRTTLGWADGAPALSEAAQDGHVVLELRHQDAPFAALELAFEEPPRPALAWALSHLAQDLTNVIDVTTSRRLRDTLTELRDAMYAERDLGAFVANAVALAARFTRADSAMLLLSGRHGPEPLAALGEWNQEPSAVARRREIAVHAARDAGPARHEGGLVSVPIASSPPARCVLLLCFRSGREVHTGSLPTLAELANVAAPFVDSLWRDTVLTRLLELNNASEETSTTEMYGRVLRTALQLVPGADCGTLLTRTDPDSPFEYKAAEGFDLAKLQERPVTEEAAIAWYGADEAGWRQGLPRILHRDEADIVQLGAASTPGTDPDVMSYHLIKSTLCLPVLRDGNVMAVLNLDDLHAGSGLARDSAQLAYLFGAPLASLLRRQQTRDVLRRAAHTDELTGLANRRAFDEALRREITRAERGGVGPSVLLMDLQEFKAVNDRYGHAKGDEVLGQVAAVLRQSLRAIDVAARRGGDEFLGLLVDTPAVDAARVKARVQHLVSEISTEVGALHINIGVASCELDGRDADGLLRLADSRMYEEKRAARSG